MVVGIITTGGEEREEGRGEGDAMRAVTAETVLTVPGGLRERAPTSAMTDQGGSIPVIETRRGTKMATQMGRLVMAMSTQPAATGKEAKKRDGSIPHQWDQVKTL